MSYTIGSRIPGTDDEHIDLLPGNSLSTIGAMADTGFDVEEIFSGFMIRNHPPAWPEDQEQEKVPLTTEAVLDAYHHAVAWALSLMQAFPDLTAAQLEDAWQHPEEHLQKACIDQDRVEALILEKTAILKTNVPDPDRIKRAVSFMQRPLYYCSTILPHVQAGKEIFIWYG